MIFVHSEIRPKVPTTSCLVDWFLHHIRYEATRRCTRQITVFFSEKACNFVQFFSAKQEHRCFKSRTTALTTRPGDPYSTCFWVSDRVIGTSRTLLTTSATKSPSNHPIANGSSPKKPEFKNVNDTPESDSVPNILNGLGFVLGIVLCVVGRSRFVDAPSTVMIDHVLSSCSHPCTLDHSIILCDLNLPELNLVRKDQWPSQKYILEDVLAGSTTLALLDSDCICSMSVLHRWPESHPRKT